jgi:predicted transcriptional regulator
MPTLHNQSEAQTLRLVCLAHKLVSLARKMGVDHLIAFTLVYLDKFPDIGVPDATAVNFEQPPV